MLVTYDERKDPIEYGSLGQVKLCLWNLNIAPNKKDFFKHCSPIN